MSGKKPARRFQTAQDLADELQRFLDGKPILSRPVSSMNRVWRWVQRKPALAGLFSTVTLLLLTLSVGGPIIASREKSLRIDAEKSNLKAIQSAILESKAKKVAQRESARAQLEEKRALEQFHAARANLYQAHMRLAMQEFTGGNIKNVRHLLDQHLPISRAPDLRSFDWYYLWKNSHPPVILLQHDESAVSATEFSPQGERFYSCSTSGTLKAWDALTNRIIYALDAHRTGVTGQAMNRAMTLSPNGEILATGGNSGLVKLWNAVKGESLGVLDRHKTSVSSLAFSGDGKWLASGDIFGTVHLWNVEKQEHVAETKTRAWLPFGRIYGLAFSGKGKTVLLAGGSDGSVKRWNPDDGTLKIDFTAIPGQEILWFEISPNKRWAITSSNSGTARLWDLTLPRGKSFKPVKSFSNFRWPRFSTDSKTCSGVEGIGHTIEFWDLETLQRKSSVHGLVLTTTTAFSPNRNSIVAGGADGTVKILKIPDTVQTTKLGNHKSEICWTAISPDGKTGVTCEYFGVPKFWDIETGKTHKLIEGNCTRVIWSPNGKYIAATENNSTVLFDAKTGKKLHKFKIPAAWSIAFSPDSRQLAVGYNNGGVRLWDVEQQKLIHTFRKSLPNVKVGNTARLISAVAFSPDGKRVIAGGQANGLHVWNVLTGEKVKEFAPNQSWIDAVKYSPDGTKIISLARSAGVKIWDAATFKQNQEYTEPNITGALAITPDGKRLIAPARDSMIVWDIQTGEQVVKLMAEKNSTSSKTQRKTENVTRGHDLVFSLALSPDGTKILTGGAKTVNLWKASTPTEVDSWNSP